ncbi:MAG: efflux RND transporter periplasmic adaptor subunit [Woeseiaceae bacterium]
MRQYLAMLFAALLFITGCNQSSQDSETANEEAAAVPVETITPVRSDIDAVYSGTAPIEAFADAMVIAKVSGEVQEIFVEEGDEIASGQILARLDGDRLRLESQQAEANLRKLERDFQRNLDLKAKGLISIGDFEKIQYEMEALQATFELSQLEFGYTEIRSPIDGVVSQRFIKVGNTIEVNSETFHVTSLEPLISYLHVPEREYRRISADQPAHIYVDALQGARFDAVVARVSPIVDPDTGTFKITIEVSDTKRQLKPGMFGRINIIYDSRANVLQIPRSAVIEETGMSYVFVVEDGVASKRVIETGFAEGGNIEIVAGVSDDDEVVFVGHVNLKDGAKVNVISLHSEVGNMPESHSSDDGSAS